MGRRVTGSSGWRTGSGKRQDDENTGIPSQSGSLSRQRVAPEGLPRTIGRIRPSGAWDVPAGDWGTGVPAVSAHPAAGRWGSAAEDTTGGTSGYLTTGYSSLVSLGDQMMKLKDRGSGEGDGISSPQPPVRYEGREVEDIVPHRILWQGVPRFTNWIMMHATSDAQSDADMRSRMRALADVILTDNQSAGGRILNPNYAIDFQLSASYTQLSNWMIDKSGSGLHVVVCIDASNMYANVMHHLSVTTGLPVVFVKLSDPIRVPDIAQSIMSAARR